VFKRSAFQVILIVLIGLLLSLSACGSKTTSTTQSSAQSQASSPANLKIDACVLLTKNDAEHILGKPVDSPTHPVQGNETYYVDSCEYKMSGGTALDNALLTIEVPSNGDLVTAQTAFATGKQQAQAAYNSVPLDVTGLGDTAYWVGASGNTLLVMKGSVTFTLSAANQKGNAPTRPIIDLAKIVLARLP
jgi:hypothetical protein